MWQGEAEQQLCYIRQTSVERSPLFAFIKSASWHKNNIAVNNLYKCLQFLGWASCEMLQKLQLTLWSWRVCLYNLNNKAVQLALDKTERHEQARYSKMQKDPQTPNLLTLVGPFEQDFGKFWESFVFMSVSSN